MVHDLELRSSRLTVFPAVEVGEKEKNDQQRQKKEAHFHSDWVMVVIVLYERKI